MSKGRDNFTKSVIAMMKDRVGARCSNPNCRVPTLAPSGKEKLNSSGIAAHIHAASEGGPRYDAKMTTEERKSIHNGLWLCANCSIKIDRDAELYPAELLHSWKNQAEQAAKIEQGKRLPTNDDIINALTTALTGVPKNILSQSICNVHEAKKKALEALDPRFKINSQYINGKSLIQIRAQEDIPFILNVKPEGAKDFASNYRSLVEHGQPVIIDTNLIEMKGSKLIDYLTEYTENGVLTLSKKKIPSIQRLRIANKDNCISASLDDIHGQIIFGTKSFEFTGSALDGIINYKHIFIFDDNIGKSDFNLNLSRWEGESINRIKHFNKLFRFFDELFKGGKILSSLEVDGNYESNGILEDSQSMELFYHLYNHLKYIKYSREISRYTNIDIKYTSNISYSYENFQHVFEIYKTIVGLNKWTEKDQSSNAKTTIQVENAENFKNQIIRSEACEIKIIDQESDRVTLFGITITLPKKIYLIKNTIIKILNKDCESIKDGDDIEIEYIPSNNYLCSIIYQNI